jgi:transposase
MKYQEINLNRQLLGPDYMIYDWKETEESIVIFAKSQSTCATCPDCGIQSDSYHATYRRNIQIVPIRLKNTVVNINAFKFDCDNIHCSRKVFMEPLSFASQSQTRSDELTALIFATAIFLSNEGASKVLKLMGVKVSNDSIKRMYEKILIEDNVDVEAIGIDDVAIRKGQTYATAIYDSKTRQLIALLEGRDAETLKTWLKKHTKIKIVSRDRASAYAKAINDVLPECIQVADRFHLIQNLIDKMKEIFRDELPKEIFIKDGEIIKDKVEKVQVLKVPVDSPLLNELSYNNTAPVDEDGEPILFDNKNRFLGSKQYDKHTESRKKNKN